MPELSHDEAVDALMKIRQASDLADIAEGIAFRAKCDAKAAKATAEIARRHAREIARMMTRPLPLFDRADGMTSDPKPAKKGRGKAAEPAPVEPSEPATKPLPWEDTPVAELTIPAEAIDALQAFGIRTAGLMVKFMKAGCDWAIVPGMGPSAAGRIDPALIDFLERNRTRDSQEGGARA